MPGRNRVWESLLKVLVATSECVPFAKTGGLADVCGALPIALANLGHRASVIMPAYPHVHHLAGQPIEPLGLEFIVPIGGKTVTGRLLRSSLPGGQVPVYLVQQDDYYDREELYRSDGADYVDNCERFVFFCRAIFEAIRLLDLEVDVLHLNDWQTGLAAAYLKIEYARDPRHAETACLMTLHNLAYQGVFWHWDMLLTGLDWKYFNWHQMEFHERLNLLKTGIVFADSINTVSPQYAEEIQGPPLGCGLEGVLSHRSDLLSGIVNGVDYGIWNPATDPHLAANYDADNWRQGKAACKAALQSEMGLPVRPEVPLIGFIGRLADQKGLDLMAKLIPNWSEQRDIQWVLLGRGEPDYERLLAHLASVHSERVAVHIGFSDPLAHRIEAGADIFLMPSEFEPCGLNQQFSLEYGTVPVLRAIGGFVNTVTDTDETTLANGSATGFQYHEHSYLALEEALDRACNMLVDAPETWSRVVEIGMRQDRSWARAAGEYVKLYEKTIDRRAGRG
jgi:starch synthase